MSLLNQLAKFSVQIINFYKLLTSLNFLLKSARCMFHKRKNCYSFVNIAFFLCHTFITTLGKIQQSDFLYEMPSLNGAKEKEVSLQKLPSANIFL